MFGSSFTRSFARGERPGSTISQSQIASTAVVWYDAASPSYFQPSNPTNGASLSQWNDRSIGAHNAGPSGGANKPTYVIPAQNNFGAVNLVSSQNLQVTNTSSWQASKSALAIFTVAKLNTNTTGVRTLTQSDQGGAKIQLNNGAWTVASAGGTGTTTAITADTNYHIFSHIFNGSETGNANRLRFRYDLQDYTLDFGATTVGTITNANTNKFNLGWDGAGNYWLGQIAETLVFTAVQGPSQIAAIEQYLKDKWGL